MLLRRLGLLCVVLLAGCTKKIPGTTIDDKADNRAILNVIEAYRVAVERRDAQAIYDLAHPGFRDDGGSISGRDDLEYGTMVPTLTARFSRLSEVRLDVVVRRIAFDETGEEATATYTYSTSFQLAGVRAMPLTEADIKQMRLKRTGKHQWKIASGI